MDPTSTPILFAAGIGDWLEALLPVLLGLFWIASQVFNALKAAGRARQQPPVMRPPRPRPVVGPARAEDIRAELERQIGEFLERPQPPAARPAPRRPRPTSGPPAGRKVAKALPPVPGADEAAAPDHHPLAAQGVSVARHVQDSFGPELKHIASSLPGASPAGAESQRPGAATRAEELASALRNPATLRQLVLLREILERPVDRW
ncbi:MAG: hypothetical protein ACKONH_08440 [Planctomycetia bacterium]